MAELDTRGYHPSLARLLLLARDLGWSITQQNSKRKGHGGSRIHSPVTSKTISVPQSTQVNYDKEVSLYRQVAAHSDPDRLKKVRAAIDALAEPDLPEYLRDEIRDEIAASGAGAIAAGLEAGSLNPPGVEIDDLPIHTRPWLAKKGRDLYESSAVLEVVQGGQVLTYRCAVDTCDYESPDPQSVAAHYRRKKDSAHEHHRPQEPVVARNPDPPTPRGGEYHPSDRLVRMLAHALQQAMADEYTAEDLAEAALRWAHDRPDLDRVEREPRELTAEEIVERIRSLVASDEVPVLRGQVDSLSEKVQQLAADAERVQEQANEYRRRAERAESDLTAFAELAQSLSR